ncbi:MAG TPA: PAS domain S-box protein [Bryobacteraceae bacterium]|nr:PAS domain S-box protein [Bryobacteraceae bacterium]
MSTQSAIISRRGERLLLLSALLLVLLIAILSYRGWLAFKQQSDQLAATRQIVDGTNEFLASLKDAETGQRGFLLTGRNRYLEPYAKALRDLPNRLDDLASAMRTRPDEAKRLEALRPLINNKLDELRRTIDLRRQQGPEAALAVVLTDRGKDLMEQVRQFCADIQRAAYARLADQSAKARSSANQIGFISTLGSSALFVLLFISSMTLQRASRQRETLIHRLEESQARTREARDWLQTTISSIGDAVIATDPAGRVTLMNGIAQSLTGWTQEQALGRSLEEVFVITNEETGTIVENPVTKALREGCVVGLANHTHLTAKDGRKIAIDDSAAPIRDGAQNITGVVLVFRDISHRRGEERVEKEAALASARLAAIIAYSDDAIIGKDLNGIVTSWNRGAERVFGYTSEEMIGRPISIIASSQAPDEMPVILERIRKGEHIDHFETVRRTKSGRDIHIALTVSPIRDADDVIVGASKVARDITDRVEAEKERRHHAELIERSNAELQHFAYAASHDLREPLRTITAHSQLLQLRAGPRLDEQTNASLGFIVSGTARMGQLIDALLEYAKVGEIAGSPAGEVPMGDIVSASLENLQRAIQDSNALITHDPLPAVLGNELHLIRLLQNLIGNALKYRRDEAPAIHISAKRVDEQWLFSVSDNGQGIPLEYHSQVFQIFKRLHGQDYSGAGIGLATCKKIVERLGGRIWVESETGKGSTFFFTMPATMVPH